MRLQGKVTMESTSPERRFGEQEGAIAGAARGNEPNPPTPRRREGTTPCTGRSTSRDQTGSRLRGRGVREPRSRRWCTETVKVGPYSNYPSYGSPQYEFPKRDE